MKSSASLSASFRTWLLDLSVDRLTAFSRLALAGLGLTAIYLDPTQPVLHGPITYLLLIAFLLYSLIIAAFSLYEPLSRLGQFVTHLVDIVVFSTLMHLTEGPTSPFFVLFTFTLLTATLRWNWLGAVLTTAILIVLLGLISLAEWQSFEDPDSEITRLIMRGTYLIVAGAMLGYVGAFRERSRERLIQIAAWPSEQISASAAPPLQRSLAHTAEVTRAGRVLVVWEELDEPFLNTEIWTGTRSETSRLRPEPTSDLVAPELEKATFIVDVGSGEPPALAGGERMAIPPPYIAPALVGRFQIKRAITAPVASSNFQGRIFLLDLTHPSDDLIPIARIAASRVEIELEHHRLRRELAERAAIEERVRVARDIHDGVLQALTAVGFRLKQLSHQQLGTMGAQLEDLRLALADQQRRLRAFVTEAIEQPLLHPRQVGLIEIRDQLLTTMLQQWNCDLWIEISPETASISRGLGDHVLHIIAEAVANAVRHGHATRVTAVIKRETSMLSLRISDNGRGLGGVSGTFDGAALADRQVGPRSIRERVDSLRGRLVLSSSSCGLAMTIEIPA